MIEQITPAPRGQSPWDYSGITRWPDGIDRYDALPPSLIHMLREAVDAEAANTVAVQHHSFSLPMSPPTIFAP